MYKVTYFDRVIYLTEDEALDYFLHIGTNETDHEDIFFNTLAIGYKITMKDSGIIEEFPIVDEENLQFAQYFSNFDNDEDDDDDGFCEHENKIKNVAGGISFWYCQDCKKDLGDA